MNRKKVSSAAELTESFDLAAVRGYFLGGSLSDWLRSHGGEEYADKLDGLSENDPELNRRLSEVFGKPFAPADGDIRFDGNGGVPALTGANGSFISSYGSSGSGTMGSFSAGSAYGSSGSHSAGSAGSFNRFSLWEWEWEWRFGRRSSFSGSFHFGSYSFGSGAYLLGSFGASGSGGSFSGSFGGSFGALGSSGSFGSGGIVTADEYDRIMYECLRRCPLDRYGYGIHAI